MIEIKNLTYRYPSADENPGHLAIDGIDLTINKGEFVAILGHNGSGKSTLGKLLNAQIFPTEGDIILDELNTKNEDTIRILKYHRAFFSNIPDSIFVFSI